MLYDTPITDGTMINGTLINDPTPEVILASEARQHPLFSEFKSLAVQEGVLVDNFEDWYLFWRFFSAGSAAGAVVATRQMLKSTAGLLVLLILTVQGPAFGQQRGHQRKICGGGGFKLLGINGQPEGYREYMQDVLSKYEPEQVAELSQRLLPNDKRQQSVLKQSALSSGSQKRTEAIRSKREGRKIKAQRLQ